MEAACTAGLYKTLVDFEQGENGFKVHSAASAISHDHHALVLRSRNSRSRFRADRSFQESPKATNGYVQTSSLRVRNFTHFWAGWNSWNTFKLGINQTIVEGTAQALVDTGLRDAGYTYLVMDDGWQNLTRGPDGRQQANATRFPSGLKVLADELHEKGLKFGLYR